MSTLVIAALASGATLFAAAAIWLRWSAVGADLTLLEYLGFLVVALAVTTITFNAVRLAEHVTVADLLLAAGGLLMVSSLLLRPLFWESLPVSLLASMILIILSGLLAALLTPIRVEDSLVRLGELSVAAVGVPIIIGVAATSSARLSMLVSLWIVSASSNGIVAMLDAIGITKIGPALTSDHNFAALDRFNGLTTHPNNLAFACAMTLPIAASLASTADRWLRRLAYALLLPGLALGLLLSGSRGGLATAAAGLMLAFVLQPRARKGILLLTSMGVVSVIAGAAYFKIDPAILFSAIERLTGAVAETGLSSRDRVVTWQDTLFSISENPITGHGFYTVKEAHDIYLQFLVAGGIVALSGFLAYVVYSMRFAWRLMRKYTVDGYLYYIAVGLFAALVVFLTEGLVRAVTFERYLYVPIGLMIGLRVVTLRADDERIDSAA